MGLSALPQVSRQRGRGKGRAVGEEQRRESGDSIEGFTCDSSGIPQQLNGKSGWGLLASAEKIAPAQWGMANRVGRGGRPRGEPSGLAWKAAPLQPASCQLGILRGTRGVSSGRLAHGDLVKVVPDCRIVVA